MIFSAIGYTFSITLVLYVFVVWALIRLFRNYDKQNWVWLAIMFVGLLFGVAPFIAIAYLLVTRNKSRISATTNNGVVYNTDGSYAVYKAEDTSKAPSAGRVAFKILLSVIFAAMIACGLLIVGVFILIATAPKGSKGM